MTDQKYFLSQKTRISNGKARQYTKEEIEERKKEFSDKKLGGQFYLAALGLLPAYILITFLSHFLSLIILNFIAEAPMLPPIGVTETAIQAVTSLFTCVLSFLYTILLIQTYGRRTRKPLLIIFSVLGCIAFVFHIFVLLSGATIIPSGEAGISLIDSFFVIFPINFYSALLCIIINPFGCNKCGMTYVINDATKETGRNYRKVYDEDYVSIVDHHEKEVRSETYHFCIICERIKRKRHHKETSRASFYEYSQSKEGRNDGKSQEELAIERLIDAFKKNDKL